MKLAMLSTGLHAQTIAEHFDGRVAFEPGDRPIGDTLAIVLFSNRSGSNLLAEYLRSAGGFRGLSEVLNHDTVRRVSADRGHESFGQYLRALHDANDRPGSVFGVKA